MATETRSRLFKLSDSTLTVKDPSEDIRGRKVLDKNGDEVGTVDDLLLDDGERKVRFLRVVAGGFLGIGEHKFLVPVDSITRLTGDAVYVDRTREHVAGGPAYDPAIDQDEAAEQVYSHYGMIGFWGQDYIYPPFPQYP